MDVIDWKHKSIVLSRVPYSGNLVSDVATEVGLALFNTAKMKISLVD